MGLFSFSTRIPIATGMPSDHHHHHRHRRRSSHSSKASTSTSETTIHHPMARDSTSRTSRSHRSHRQSSIPVYTVDPESPPSESESDTTNTPAIGLFPPRTRESGILLPPPAPTPPPIGSAPGGYTYVPAPVVYKEEGSDTAGGARKRNTRSKHAEKVVEKAALEPQALPSTATKLLLAPAPASAVVPLAVPSRPARLTLGTGGAPQGMLQRVRVRAKASLERFPRVHVPPMPRPSITIRIPLPRLPKLPRMSRVRVPPLSLSRFFWGILAAMVIAMTWLGSVHYETATLRLLKSPGLNNFDLPDQALTCTIDTSKFPVSSALAMKSCVDSTHVGWSESLVVVPPGPLSQAVGWGLTTCHQIGELTATGLDRLRLPNASAWVHSNINEKLSVKAKDWMGVTRVKLCGEEAGVEIKYGAFLIGGIKEKEACWEKCRQMCLDRAAKAVAVGAECKIRGGKVGRCWASYTLEE